MLRIIQQQFADAATSYYSQADYYNEEQELAGIWSGEAATMLGLSGEVKKQDFDRLRDNQDPRSRERLTLRNRANRSVGYDFNWHVPKGVSLAYSLNDNKRIANKELKKLIERLPKPIDGDAVVTKIDFPGNRDHPRSASRPFKRSAQWLGDRHRRLNRSLHFSATLVSESATADSKSVLKER